MITMAREKLELSKMEIGKPATLKDCILTDGNGNFGHYFVIGNENTSLFVSEGLDLYDRLKEREKSLEGKAFDFTVKTRLDHGKRFYDVSIKVLKPYSGSSLTVD